MELTINLLTVAVVIVALLLVLIVLMQRPKTEGLGAAFGEGVTSQVWGAQTTNVLQKGTTFFGILLFLLTLASAGLTARQNSKNHQASLIGTAALNAPKPTPPAPPPAATPAAPAAPQVTPTAPAAPAAPAAPKPETTKPAEAPKAATPAPATTPAAPAATTPAPASPAPATPPAAPAGQPK